MKSHKEVKKIIKRNELGDALGAGADFLQSRGKFVVALVVAAALAGLGVLGYKMNRIHQISTFNQKLFETQEGLNKEQNLQTLIREYSDLPAHVLARLQLADYLIENQKPEDAVRVLEEGLAQVSEPNILSTLAVLKITAIQRQKAQYSDAAQGLSQKIAKVLPAYRPYLKMIQADLYALAGQDSQARLLYMEVSQDPSKLPEGAEKWEFDPYLIKQAKDKLLSLELK